MLTKDEQMDTLYYVAMDNSLQLSYFFLWVPICFAFFARYRRDPVNNAHMRNRILYINTIQLSFWLWANYKKGLAMSKMERKYLADLSDYEINNFD